jgi:hypothetical protein
MPDNIWPNGRNLVFSDDGELCAVTPGPNLVPATSEEIEKFNRGGGFIPSEKFIDNEIPV